MRWNGMGWDGARRNRHWSKKSGSAAAERHVLLVGIGMHTIATRAEERPREGGGIKKNLRPWLS